MKKCWETVKILLVVTFLLGLFQNCQDLAPLPDSESSDFASNNDDSNNNDDDQNDVDNNTNNNSGPTSIVSVSVFIPGMGGFADNIQGIDKAGEMTALGLDPGGTTVPLGTATISACAQVELSDAVSTTVELEYMSVQNFATAMCNPANGCGTSPGLRVFASLDGLNWNSIGRVAVGEPSPANFTPFSTRAPSPFQFLLICRAGGGPNRDTLLVGSLAILP